jgi:hypothetical protein
VYKRQLKGKNEKGGDSMKERADGLMAEYKNEFKRYSKGLNNSDFKHWHTIRNKEASLKGVQILLILN